MHGLKKSDKSFSGFGEAYFSTVKFNKIKGWKLHKKMTLNLVVPHGEIRIIAHKASDNDDVVSPLVDIVLGKNNYSRITIPPGNWVAFKGIGKKSNILMNIADIEHDPKETINKDINFFKVDGFE
tara:strand:+ start:10274 stop:10648 length:375 start_codon:yes stop_codon:yes gene_type:complete